MQEQKRASFFNPGPSVWRYVVRMGLISLVPSLLIGVVIFVILSEFTDSPLEYGPQYDEGSPLSGLALFFSVVVIGPAIETLLMSAVLWGLSFITRKVVHLAVLSAVVWAMLHSLMAPIWGLVIAWPFYVFSRAYLAWRPYGWWKSVGITSCIHMFQNLLPGLILSIG